MGMNDERKNKRNKMMKLDLKEDFLCKFITVARRNLRRVVRNIYNGS